MIAGGGGCVRKCVVIERSRHKARSGKQPPKHAYIPDLINNVSNYLMYSVR